MVLVDGTLTIGKATLTITGIECARSWEGANPTVTGTIFGLQNGDGISATYFTAADATSPVGPYAVVPTAVDSSPSRIANYDVVLVDGTLTIGKATLTITGGDFARTYGAANPTLTGTIAGLQNGDGISATYFTAADATSPVGPYAVVPTAVDSSPSRIANYDVVLVDGTLTIGKATLTITGGDFAHTYGAANPTLTGTIAGLQNGDGISATYFTAADATSPVGPYAVVPTAVDSSPSRIANYDVVLVDGTLTIGKATLTIT